MTTPEERVAAESGLAKLLLGASTEDRLRLYGPVYDKIFSMHLSHDPNVLDFGAHLGHLPTLINQTKPGDHVIEIGCGMGLLAIGLRDSGRRVTAVDVSEVALDQARKRAGDLDNLEFLRVEGVRLRFPKESFDFAYSVEVLEHLHEADASDHFCEALRVLKPGAHYWLMTPSRYLSPAAAERAGVDVSVDADIHLKEWTHRELRVALQSAGFDRVTVPSGTQGLRMHLAIPSLLAGHLERIQPLRMSKIGGALGLKRCTVRARKPIP